MKCFRLLLFLSFLFTACTNGEGTAERAESDLDAARMFIRDALDGKYEKAKQLMVSDSTNNQWIGDLERKYEGLPASEKRGYRESSITIHDTRRVNDSSSVVVYSNT